MRQRVRGERVTIFPTCLVEIVRPRVIGAARRMLARFGVDARVCRPTGCCGQPAWNAGFTAEARRVAARTLRGLARTDGPIVVPSGSCTVMIHRHWSTLFAGTPHETAAGHVASRVHELASFCAPLDERSGPAVANDRPAIAYHASCHLLRELRAGDAPIGLLRAGGYDVVEPADADRCCGFGGTFSVTLPELSVAMADEKLDDLTATGAREVTGCDLSCLIHLEGRARRRALPLEFRHVAEVLDG